MNDQEIRALAERMIEEDHPLVDWDTQAAAIASIPSDEDVAELFLESVKQGRAISCMHRDQVIATHERLIRQALARMEEQQ